MRLHELLVKNYRGIESAHITFDDAVTVIEGDNEAGKSSLIEAMGYLREVKDSTKAAKIKAVQPVGQDVGPEVQLRLTTGDYHMTYRKRWIKKPLTELQIHAPAPAQYSGGEAHDMFDTILKTTADVDLLGGLVVPQTQSLNQAGLGTITAIQQALSDQPADDHDDLLDRIKAEYDKYWSPTGREKSGGELAAAKDQETASEQEFKAAQEAEQNYLRYAEELDVLIQARRDLDQRKEASTQELQRTTRDWESVQELLQQRDDALATRQRAARETEDVKRSVAQRQRYIDALDHRQQQHHDATEASNEAQERREVAEEALAVAETDHEQAEAALRDAQTAQDEAQRNLAHAEEHDQQLAIRERARMAQELSSQLDAVIVELEGCIVDDEAVSELTGLQADVDRTRAQQELILTTVTIEAHDTTVQVADEVVTEGTRQAFELGQPTEISIGTYATITVSPPHTTREADQLLTTSQAALADALTRYGVTTVDQARERARDRRERVTAQLQIEARLAAHLGEEELDELLAVLDQPYTHHNAEDLATAQQRASEADQALQAARHWRDTTLAALTSAQQKTQLAAAQCEQRAALLSAAEGELSAARHDLETERQSISDEELNHRLTTCEAADSKAREEHERILAQLAERDAEAIENSYRAAQQDADSLALQRQQNHDEILRLEGVIEHTSSNGLYDVRQQAEAELERATARRERIEAQAQAVKLLYTTMTRHKEQAQQQYAAPFATQLQKLARPLFGDDFQVSLDDNLAVASRTLDGHTVTFDQLSVGTREQLSLLGRLAAAQLVDPANGAPVVLDDTLGYADPGRVEAISDIINNLTGAQIIILTCQPERFATVKGLRHRIGDREIQGNSLG